MRGAQRECSAVWLRAEEKMSATALIAWFYRWGDVEVVGAGERGVHCGKTESAAACSVVVGAQCLWPWLCVHLGVVDR